MSTEYTILSQLLVNEKFARRALPYINAEYFHQPAEVALFTTFNDFWEKYNVAPTKDALVLELTNSDKITDTDFDDAMGIIEHEFTEEIPNFKWLIETTEVWCQDRAIHNAISDSISIIDGEDTERTRHAIPEILKAALAVSFESSIGHDYLDDAEARYEFYGEEHSRLPFDIDILNTITNGGCPDGTLNVLLAGTNVGKTLALIHFAAGYMRLGKNVLYVTLEMAEEEIARRVDANQFNVKINDVEKIEKSRYEKGIAKLKKMTDGKLIVKQYPTGAGHVGHFRQDLQDMWLKKNFKPDVIMVDYIGICASSRVKLGSTSSYFYVKAVAEELRGMGIEYQCPVWTAVQATRGGFSNTDMDITDTAESFGLPATADLMLGVIRTEELDALGQLMIKQLKNRYGNKNNPAAFTIGVEVEKQQLFDVEQNARVNVDLGADTPPPEPKLVTSRKRDRKKAKKSSFAGVE